MVENLGITNIVQKKRNALNKDDYIIRGRQVELSAVCNPAVKHCRVA